MSKEFPYGTLGILSRFSTRPSDPAQRDEILRDHARYMERNGNMAMMHRSLRHPRRGIHPARVIGIALMLLLLAAISVGASAGEALGGKLRTGNTVTVPASETVHGDLYIGAGTVRVDGRVEGDLIVAGGTVDLNGIVTGDILAAGGTLTINGTTGGSIRAMGGTITVGGAGGRDVVAAGGQLALASSSRVTGDVIFTGGQLTLDGAIDGNVLGSASTYTKNGTVKGTESVTIQQRQQQQSQPWGPLAGVRSLIVRYLGVLLFGLLLLWLLPRAIQAIGGAVGERPLHSLGVGALGILGLIATPVGIILLMLVLAIPLGLLGFGLLSGFTVFGGLVSLVVYAFALAVFLLFLADAWVGYALGKLILTPVHAPWARKPVPALLVGATIVMLLTAIPIVGGVIKFAVIVLALGGLIVAISRRTHPAVIAPTIPIEPGMGHLQPANQAG